MGNILRKGYSVTKLILAQDDSNHLQLQEEELNVLTSLKPHPLIVPFPLLQSVV